MTLAIHELAEEIAGIFEHSGWVWGLALAGIPEQVPDVLAIAAKIGEVERLPSRRVLLASHGRIVLVTDDPKYPEHVRVLLDVGQMPLPERDA